MGIDIASVGESMQNLPGAIQKNISIPAPKISPECICLRLGKKSTNQLGVKLDFTSKAGRGNNCLGPNSEVLLHHIFKYSKLRKDFRSSTNSSIAVPVYMHGYREGEFIIEMVRLFNFPV